MAIEPILALNEDELLERIRKNNISMCGYGPIVSVITVARELGAKRAELVMHRTSGDTSGDYSSVVGYAGIINRNIHQRRQENRAPRPPASALSGTGGWFRFSAQLRSAPRLHRHFRAGA